MAPDSDSRLCPRCKNPAFKPRCNVNTAELLSKLRSDFGPTSSPRAEIEETLLLLDKDMADYESEIVHLQSQILYVEAQMKRLFKYKAKYQLLLSPIRRLPNETLERIFLFACDMNLLQEHPWTDADHPPATKLSLSPLAYLPALTISSVCTRWRCLALSLPALWSKIRLEILSDSWLYSSDKFFSAVQLYLDRSVDHPLSLQLDVKGTPDDDGPTLLVLVAEQNERWQSCTYRGRLKILSQVFSELELRPLDFPILEDLNVSGLKGWNITDFDFFEHSPNLQALTSSSPISSTKLPLRQLIKIIVPLDSRKGMFEMCPNIITAELQQRNVKGLYSSRGLTVQRSSSARSLTLAVRETEGECFVEEVFLSHSLPALTELHLYAFDTTQLALDWPKEAFKVFVSSACSITTLSFCNVGLRDSDLVSILQLLPSVVDFRFQDRYDTERSPVTSLLISHLHDGANDQSGSSPLLPNLLCLSLDAGKSAAFDDAAFVSMIASRWLPDPEYAAVVGVACLRSLVLRIRHRAVDKEVYKPLEYLDRMGMRVVVNTVDATGNIERIV